MIHDSNLKFICTEVQMLESELIGKIRIKLREERR